MFPEYSDLISSLKAQNADFERKCVEHNQLDEDIKQLEKRVGSDFNPAVKELKSRKLHLKEEIYQILKSHG
ncbi:DUF465 domain-containing protein [Shewanella sp. A25]|nr:DUF465 domain-containing protein [Shewanella shenzhenensis]